MSFGAPGYLAFVALVPLMLGVAAAWVRWQARVRAEFGVSAKRRASSLAALALLVLAVGFAAVASARPQIGSRDARVEQRGVDVAIVLDVSQSMFSDDLAPTRLGRAQAELTVLLGRMQGDRVGLVVFAGQPLVRSPLTSDLAALSRLVAGVHEERGLLPPGSDMGAAIRAAVKLLNGGEAQQRAIIVISDGEDFGTGSAAAVAGARSNGWPVFTAGVGTTGGAAVVDINPDTGARTPRIGSDGVSVISRLNEAGLREMAAAGDGRYIALRGEGRPLAGLAPELEALGATTFDAKVSRVPIDRFSLFAWMALALAVEATLLPIVASAYAWRRVARLLPLLGAALFVAAVCGGGVSDLNQRANVEHNAGAYDEALQLYATAQAIDGARGELYYNAGNSLGDKGESSSAIDETRRGLALLETDDAAIAEYALGTHYARSLRLADAIEAYKRALLADPSDPDAKHNLEVVLSQVRPTATPTARVPLTPEASPSAIGGDGEPSEGPSTPGPGSGEPTTESTPGAGEPQGTPQPGDTSDLTPEQLQRALEDALRGIDEDFTVEEALRALDLLNQRNRGDLAEPPGGGNGGAPDY